MKALFCYDGPLYKDVNGHYYDSILNDQMFARYFKVANSLEILIRMRNIETDAGCNQMNRLTNPKIQVTECPNLSSVTGLITSKSIVKQIIEDRIQDAEAVFIRLPSVIGYIAVDVCKKKKKKYLIEVVGCPWDSYWNYSVTGKFIAPLAALAMKTRILNAPYVIYVTNNFLQNRYPTKGKQISCSNVELPTLDNNIINNRLRYINNKRSDELFVIGTAAGLDVPYKGQHYVIRALGILKQQGLTQIEYQLIGGGTGEYLTELAKIMGVEKQIKIVGQMPHDKVFPWLDGLDAYIQPSRQEGLPRSMIEAMSRALPCLGAKTAGIPELIESECIFSNSQNEIYEIAELLRRLYMDKTSQKHQAIRNFDEAKKYQKEILTRRRTLFFEAFVRGIK